MLFLNFKYNRSKTKLSFNEECMRHKTVNGMGSFFSGMLDRFENFHYALSELFGKNAQNYIELETIANDDLSNDEKNANKPSYTLLARDGSLLTVIEFNGVKDMLNASSFMERVHKMDEVIFSPLLSKSKHHTIDIFFAFDPEHGKEIIQKLTLPTRQSADTVHLNIQDIIESRENNLPKFIHQEKCYIGIWTHTSVINDIELKHARQDKQDYLKKISTYPMNIKDNTGQYIYAGLEVIQEHHNAIVYDLLANLNSEVINCDAYKISAVDALRVVREMLYRDETPPNWKPVVTGDAIPMVMHKTLSKDAKGKNLPNDMESLLIDKADFIYPSLSHQLFMGNLTRKEDNRFIEVGNRTFAPCYVELPPEKYTDFNSMFRRFKEAKLPFYMRINLQSGGLESLGMKRTVASALSFLSEQNRKINEAIQRLQVIAEKECVVRYNIAFTTYAPIGDDSLLRSRYSQMMQIISSWGNCAPKSALGDPLINLFEVVPFVSPRVKSNPMVADVFSLTKMLPLFRPSALFNEGASIFRTEDGKVSPFELCSPKQNTWAYYIFAPPGSGKSVLLSGLLLGAMTQAGIKKLPYISILDIGPSSKYMVDMIRDSLPTEQKHLAISIQATMDKRMSINMFDLPLGCEHPDSTQFGMLNNWLNALMTPAGGVGDPDFPDLISKIIRRAYVLYSTSRDGRPKPYSPNIELELDDFIRKKNIPITLGHTSWYELRDIFFDMNEIKFANIAQRHGVPVLSDLIAVANEKQIRDTFNFNASGSNEDIISKFTRVLTTQIETFPNLSLATAFDIGNARIASVDLDLVAPPTGLVGAKQTEIMMMVWKYALTKNFYITKELVMQEFPEKYKPYHLARLEDIFISNKFFIMDELHRAKSSNFIQADIENDIRVSRKRKMALIFASQSVNDLKEDLRNMLSGIFILKAANKEEGEQLAKQFSFGKAEEEALLRYCTGPTEKGAPFLMIMRTRSGTFSQINYSTIAPTEAWALSTTAEDVKLRGMMYQRLSLRESRARLGRAYPYTARNEIESLNQENAKLPSPIQNFDAYDVILKRLLDSPPIYDNRIGAVTDIIGELQMLKEHEIKERERKMSNYKSND